MGTEMIGVGICDDSTEVRSQLAAYVATGADLTVRGMYACGPAAIAGVGRDGVDVLLLDVRMPKMTGPAVATELASSGSGCKVLYITSYPEEVPVRGALRSTVLGALSKDLSPENLVSAIRLVASGISLLGPEFIGQRTASGPDLVARVAKDSRDLEVLAMVRQGASNPEIAAACSISVSRVKQIIATMCRRAGVASRTELAWFSGDAADDGH
ncbi:MULTISPECIES: response regulator transcription factor [Acidipropionibacterium]|uniref:response regulator transcription factor n=1 Tax=Acidipropionibacterium TaxID=1912215 RepID=UPI0003FA9820|nr:MULTISPECIES: response regulator transcription factor [Acidipropionibacterium]MDN5977848.1 response regulator transcription factor [Acidipropionibacterium jensenii]MDN5996814.1 response regulator transcription factor [Acidipropionibacterium jensenii]MDN6427130.1 response regulator transcription factor [Acidipropionibacterium jensenii]MDN6441643.1 response regulator transcription factor [Acidipropionibacterium jensenii]MDN6480747.1 response regulator transcription factor [Acidipropionibacter